MKWLLCCVLCLVTLVTLVSSGSEDEPEPKKAIDFPNLTLFPLDGDEPISLDKFKGRPVLLSFWASWCGPCRWELPEFQRLYDELSGQGFMLVTINLDDSVELANRFLSATGLGIPVYRISPEEQALLGVTSLPTSVLLNNEGKAIAFYRGYAPKVKDEVRELVTDMLREPVPRAVEPSDG